MPPDHGQESQEPLCPDVRTLFEVFPILWFRLDANNRYQDFRTHEGGGLFVPPEAFLGKDVAEVLPPETTQGLCAALDRARGGERPASFEYSLPVGSGGRRRYFEARLVAAPDGSVEAFILDVSVQKRYAEQLVARERRFRRLVAAGWDIIVLIETDGTVLDVSPSVSRVLGWTDGEFVGTNVLDLLHPEDVGTASEAIGAIMGQPGQRQSAITRHRHKDGQWRWLESTVTNQLDDPHLRCHVVNSRDVTEQKHLEERLRAAQRLEELGRLAGSVAHDFNNLLTVILGYAEALAAETRDQGLDALHVDLQEVLAAGRRGRELTRQLLAFARRQVVEPRILDLNQHLASLETILSRLLGEDVLLALDLAPEPLHVKADPVQLEQILINLAVNARDAMPKGGRFHVRTRPSDDGRLVELTVRDTGIGIHPEIIGQIFEPFFTTKPNGQGTGLGLPTVQNITAQLGGTISVASAPAQGTTFTLRLPLETTARSAAAEDLEEAPSAVAPTALSILLVEDEPAVRLMIARALTHAGHRVTEAEDGVAALTLISDPCPYDAVITDVAMPHLSGPELMAALRKRHPELPVLLISGYTSDHRVAEALREPATAFLAKPLTPRAVLARLGELTRGAAESPTRTG